MASGYRPGSQDSDGRAQVSQYAPAWTKWLAHIKECADCSSASSRPSIGKVRAFYCENGIVMLQRLEEIARLEDDE